MTKTLYIGLMSGTSLDGVDAALCRFEPTFELLGQYALPMPRTLRDELLTLQSASPNELHTCLLAGNALAECYAAAIQGLLSGTRHSAEHIAAIGCHGQTLRHRPALGFSLQINNPARLVELTGIDVIADFRNRDIAAGGQGAPLVPAFHAALFRDQQRHRGIVNVGGMSNITNLPPSGPITGFDCGPGNVLMDAWIQRHLHKDYDQDGAWATTGNVDEELLSRLLNHDFLQRPPPKSCGREDFDLAWLDRQLGERNASPADVQATLLAFTATCIARAVERYCVGVSELYICGGGARNDALLRALGRLLPHLKIATTAALGLPVDAVEAAAFAWLAMQHLQRRPGNLPEVTGARGPRILGAHYPA